MTATEGHASEIELTPLEQLMVVFDLSVAYIFPPRSDGKPYDFDLLHASFIETINTSYPSLVGKLEVDMPTHRWTLAVSKEAQAAGAAAIPFEVVKDCKVTTEQVAQAPSMLFLPQRDPHKNVIAIKCTLLADGGLLVGFSVSHALMDGETMFTFFNVWGMTYRGVPQNERPVISHDRTVLYATGKGAQLEHPEFTILPGPAYDGVRPMVPPGVQLPPCHRQAFHMSTDEIAKLKAAVTATLAEDEYVSTVDTLSALMTILVAEARGQGKDTKTNTLASMRRYLPIPKDFAGYAVMGELATHPAADVTGDVTADKLGRIAHRIREALKAVDGPTLRDQIEYMHDTTTKKLVDVGMAVNSFFGGDLMITSWLHLGTFNVNFGEPARYIGPPDMPFFDGMVTFVEGTPKHPGVDIVISLEAHAGQHLVELWNQCKFVTPTV